MAEAVHVCMLLLKPCTAQAEHDFLYWLATILGLNLSFKTHDRTSVNKMKTFYSSPFSLFPLCVEQDRPLIANTLSNDSRLLFIRKVICEPITIPLTAVSVWG